MVTPSDLHPATPHEGPTRMRADARRNREQLLAAAEQAFADEGLGVPVDEIARRAGVGAGTLYRHFPTKEALFTAVVVQHMDDLTGRARAALETEAPGEALFGFLAELAEQGRTKRNLIDALVGAGIDIKAVAAGPKAQFEQVFAELLRKAQDAGEVRPDITITELFGLVMGTCSMAGDSDECSQRRMLSVVCAGLRPVAS